MAYRIPVLEIPMTLSDRQCRASIEGLLKCDILYICAAVYKISTHIAHCTVTLR